MSFMMTTAEWMNGGKLDTTLSAKAAELCDEAESLERVSMRRAAETYDVAADCYEQAGNYQTADNIRRRAGRCYAFAAAAA